MKYDNLFFYGQSRDEEDQENSFSKDRYQSNLWSVKEMHIISIIIFFFSLKPNPRKITARLKLLIPCCTTLWPWPHQFCCLSLWNPGPVHVNCMSVIHRHCCMFVGHWSEAGARFYSITRSVHVNKQGTSVVGTQSPRLSLTFCRSSWIINRTLLAWWRCQGLEGKALQLWKEAFLIKYKNSLLVLIVLLFFPLHIS